MRRRQPLAAAAATLAGLLNACREAPPRLESPLPGAHAGGDSLTARVVAPGSFAVLFDGQPTGPGPIPLTHVGDGLHRIAVRDAEGRVHDERDVVIDRTPPKLRLLSPGPVTRWRAGRGDWPMPVRVYAEDASPPISVTANGVPLVRGSSGVFTGHVLVRPGSDGALSFEVRAEDKLQQATTEVLKSTPGLVRWQGPIPVEPGAWTADLADDDSVLITLGEAAVLIDPDGRERWSHEVPGRILAEGKVLPGGGALLRVLHPATPGAAEVQLVGPDGKVVSWHRPDATPLALGALGEVPFVAWRRGESAEAGPAPLPWPPAGFQARPLSFEPRRLEPLSGMWAAVGDTRVAILDDDGDDLWAADLEPGSFVRTAFKKLYVAGPGGLRALDVAVPWALESLNVVFDGAVTAVCPAPTEGLTFVSGGRLHDLAGHKAEVRPGATLPKKARIDGCVAFAGDTVLPIAPAAATRQLPDLVGHAVLPVAPAAAIRQLPGPVAGAVQVERYTLAALDTSPPRAILLGAEATPLADVPLDMLANVIRVVPLPDGLLVVGLAAARPDRALLIRLSL